MPTKKKASRFVVPACQFCGKELDITSKGRGEVYWRVAGWEVGRKGGGANQIILREVIPDTYACKRCIFAQQHGLTLEGQQELPL